MLHTPCSFTPHNFGGLPGNYSELEHSQIVILPVPYDLTTSYQCGARWGPQAIINASKHLELYDEETGSEVYRLGIHTLGELEVEVASPEEMVWRVYAVAREILAERKFLVMLGGDHSLTIGTVRAYSEQEEGLSVLHLDAHADLRNSYAGAKFGHASVMRRVQDYAPTVHVGVRSLSSEEQGFIAQQQLPVFYAREILGRDNWHGELLAKLSSRVYISIDLDVLDPSIMPATGTPEPGGLGWYQTLAILRAVANQATVVGFDVVELAPLPGLVAPDFLAAKLVYKLLGYIFQHQTKGG